MHLKVRFKKEKLYADPFAIRIEFSILVLFSAAFPIYLSYPPYNFSYTRLSFAFTSV